MINEAVVINNAVVIMNKLGKTDSLSCEKRINVQVCSLSALAF